MAQKEQLIKELHLYVLGFHRNTVLAIAVLAFYCALLWSCDFVGQQKTALPPNVFVTEKDSALKNINGTWYYQKQLFNGYILEKEEDKILAKMPILEGKENGKAIGWYKNGSKKFERNFLNGNREGIHRAWYENGRLAFLYFFHEDKFEGKQMSFFESGHRWQYLNYQNGYEEGKQKTWNDSGRVINNFTVKHGKLYGVIGRYDCMSITKK